MAYCFGGRSIFWGGWSPRLTTADSEPRPAAEAAWPADAAAYLNANYNDVEKEMGVQPTTDYIQRSMPNSERASAQSRPPVNRLTTHPYVVSQDQDPYIHRFGMGQSARSEQRFVRGNGAGTFSERTLADGKGTTLAIQGQARESGLFPFDKYSSAYLLSGSIREDIGRHWRNNIDVWRRLMLLPRSQLVRLQTVGNRVTEIELLVKRATLHSSFAWRHLGRCRPVYAEPSRARTPPPYN